MENAGNNQRPRAQFITVAGKLTKVVLDQLRHISAA
jgi:hypothetical protein